MRSGRGLCALVVAALLVAPNICRAQDETSEARPGEHRVGAALAFLAGAGLGLVAHESGHLVFDVGLDAQPTLAPVHFGPFPFVAISHRSDLSPRREFLIDSAGFWVQSATSEWLLTRRPALRREHAPLAKGVLAFNILTSIGYTATAFAKAGPYERDTRGMATAAGMNERAIGAIVLAPAVLDGFRYYRPDAKWARWISRSAKVASVVLIAK